MYCCSNCFKNEEIGLIIRSISSINGSCDYCGESPVQLVDVREIVEPLQPVINLYEVSTKGEYLLHEMIQNDWSIFNLTPENANRILIDIFKDERSINREKFTEKVINVTSNHSKSLSIVEQWNALKKEIVEKNRFFIENVIDLDQLKTYLKSKAKSYKSGDIFYRGRISKQHGLGIPDIGKPPAEKATAGRANPKGIPYLYLALDIETTLYETRATYLDYVTIGTFRLKEDISIVKLRAIEVLSPFEENIFEKLIYLPFLKSLELIYQSNYEDMIRN